MTFFRKHPKLSKLSAADARWLRGQLGSAFVDGIPQSPVAVLSRLAESLESAPQDGDAAWLRSALLQEIYRGLRRYVDAVRAGEAAYRLRPWDPRSAYSLALTFQELSYGPVENTILDQTLGGLPIGQTADHDEYPLQRALADLDLTEEQAALQALALFQATLSLELRRDDIRRVRRAIAKLTDQWPQLGQPAQPKRQWGQVALWLPSHAVPFAARQGARLRAGAPVTGELAAKWSSDLLGAARSYGARIAGATRSTQRYGWKLGGAVAVVVVLIVSALGAGILLSSQSSPSGGAPPVAAAEDPTTDLHVLDQEGNPVTNPLTVFRESPATLIIRIVNHGPEARRYEIAVRVGGEDWPLGTAEVAPEAPWEAGFQMTLSQPARGGLEIVAKDAGTLALVKTKRFGITLQDVPAAVRATPEVTQTPVASATPESTSTPVPVPPRITAVGAGSIATEPQTVAPPPAPVNVPVAAPAATVTVTATRTPTATPTQALPSLPTQLPPNVQSSVVTSTATPAAAPSSTPVTTPAQATGTPTPAATLTSLTIATPRPPAPTAQPSAQAATPPPATPAPATAVATMTPSAFPQPGSGTGNGDPNANVLPQFRSDR